MNRVPSANGGFILVTVLVVTAVGLLFGAGALLLFRYQCQQRIDRQHELEKVYAVRSALNYIRSKADSIEDAGKPFAYHTGSERNLGLLVKPVKRIFPDFDNEGHLDIGNEGKNGRVFRFVDAQWNKTLDYEYGADRWNDGETEKNLIESIVTDLGKNSGFGFAGLSETNRPRCWVNIGMRETGGWLEDDYGRRYSFYPRTWVAQSDSEKTKDIMRFCIIRNATNLTASLGRKLGWPLSRNGERALVFEISPDEKKTDYGVMTVSEYGYDISRGGVFVVTNHVYWAGDIALTTTYMGMQIAGDSISAFYIRKGGGAADLTKGYFFSNVSRLTPDTYAYFADGCVKDADGRIVKSPELRAVLEVEGSSDKRPDPSSTDATFMSSLRVTPAYQYDVFLEHPHGVTNLATVAQRIAMSTVPGRKGEAYSVFTYDTHGTEHKGFRQDERERARSGGR